MTVHKRDVEVVAAAVVDHVTTVVVLDISHAIAQMANQAVEEMVETATSAAKVVTLLVNAQTMMEDRVVVGEKISNATNVETWVIWLVTALMDRYL